ncbi:MAG: hypothetical protein J6S85_03365 [Methanobrevibacter sp.]|nr:hypothetical protein [Methanobrevibacter sp.]
MLESKSDGYVLNSKYFDFDVTLFNCLCQKRQEYFLYRLNQCMTFQTLDVNAQSILDDYALREMKDNIKKGAYNTLPEFYKDWFSDKIKQNKRMQKYYGYYMRP